MNFVGEEQLGGVRAEGVVVPDRARGLAEGEVLEEGGVARALERSAEPEEARGRHRVAERVGVGGGGEQDAHAPSLRSARDRFQTPDRVPQGARPVGELLAPGISRGVLHISGYAARRGSGSALQCSRSFEEPGDDGPVWSGGRDPEQRVERPAGRGGGAQVSRSWALLAGVVGAAYAALFWTAGPVDDDFICYRFARSLVEGRGLTSWSIGWSR